MPDEPHKPIQVQLEEYAAARRRRAGGSFELPPGTRQVLDAAVERVYGLGRAADGSGWRRGLGWVRWALGGATAVVLAGVGWYGVHWRQPAAPARLAQPSRPMSTAALAQVDAAAPVQPPAATRPVTPSPAAAPPSGTAVALAVPVPAAPLPLPVPKPDLAAYPGATATPALAEVSPRESDTLTRAAEGQGTEPAGAVTGLAFVEEGAASRSGGEGMNVSTAQVLSQFRVEVAGDQLRLIDADGSVYAGGVAGPPLAGAYGRPSPARPATVRGTSRASAPRGSGKAGIAPGGVPTDAFTRVGIAFLPESDAGLPFRVEGTNRTLNQLVRVDGRLGGVSRGGTPSDGAGASFTWLSNATVRGQGVVGGTERFELNAVRQLVPPVAGPGR